MEACARSRIFRSRVCGAASSSTGQGRFSVESRQTTIRQQHRACWHQPRRGPHGRLVDLGVDGCLEKLVGIKGLTPRSPRWLGRNVLTLVRGSVRGPGREKLMEDCRALAGAEDRVEGGQVHSALQLRGAGETSIDGSVQGKCEEQGSWEVLLLHFAQTLDFHRAEQHEARLGVARVTPWRQGRGHP